MIASARTELIAWAQIGLALLSAAVAASIVPRLVRRVVRRVVDSRMRQGFTSLRARAPRVLVDSGPVPVIRYGHRAKALGTLAKHFTSGLIWLAAFTWALHRLDVALATIVTGAGFIGLAMALGAQDVLHDWVAGFFILLDDRFGAGDQVEVGGIVGEIEELTLRWTRVRDASGTEWYIPNGQLRLVGNRSQHRGKAVVDIDLLSEVDLGHALDRIKASLRDLASDPEVGPYVVGEPETLGVETLSREGPTVRVTVHTQPARQAEVARSVRARVYQAFEGVDRSPLTPASDLGRQRGGT